MEKSTAEGMAVGSEEASLLSIMQSVWKNRCVAVIVEFKIPELLCNSEQPSMGIEEIAQKTGCQTTTQLYPMMRVLAQWGIGKELENKHFCKNKALELLRRDKGPCVGHLIAYYNSEEHYSAFRSLGACVKQGKPAFVLEHGMDHYEYLYDAKKSYDSAKMYEGTCEHKIGSDSRRREFAENYSSNQTYTSYLTALPDKSYANNLHNVFPWSTCNKLVDIAGSLGSFLASILKLPGCEHIQGYVIELPKVVDEARLKIQDLDVPEHRIEFIKQDISKPLPSDLDLKVDTVMFKNALSVYISDHDMMKKMLGNCLSLFPSTGGRLLIIDFVCPDDTDPNIGINGLDLRAFTMHWLSIAGIGLLTKKEWVDHLDVVGKELGYQVRHVYDTFAGGSVIFELSYKPCN